MFFNNTLVNIKEFLFLYCLAIVFIFVACATTPPSPPDPRTKYFELFDGHFTVEVDSVADPELSSFSGQKKFIIKSGMQGITDEDLEFKIIAKYLSNALKMQNYVEAKSLKEADLIIKLSYGFAGERVHTETVQKSAGYSFPVYKTTIYVPPQYETVEYKTYIRLLSIDAYDKRTQKQVWATRCNSEGSSNDLRRVLAYMFVAAKNFLGVQSFKKEVINVNGSDTTVLDIAVGPLSPVEPNQ